MAQEYFEEGNYEEAVKAYQKALSMNYGDKRASIHRISRILCRY